MSGSASAIAAPQHAGPHAASAARRRPAAPVCILLVALVIPWAVSFGPLSVSAPRLILLLMTPMCVFTLLSGKVGALRAVDVLLVLHCLWCVVAIGAVHGVGEAIESGGMLTIETLGAYLVARCYIRSSEDFRAAARLLFLILAAILPFAVVELLTGRKVLLDLFGAVLPTIEATYTEPRMGLTRVQGPFEHPILFGVFSASAVSLTYLVLGRSAGALRRWTMTGTVMFTALLSLSSGPLLTVMMQVALLFWNGLLKRVPARWGILWALGIVGYVALEIGSSQSVAQVLTRFAFDPWTAFYRLLIFEYGWASVMAHPLFGTGFNDWLHPAWMTSSIDMFWLVPAVRHGLPAAILFLLAFFAATVGLGFKKCTDERVSDCRTAYLITLAGLFIAGCTVHFWMATYLLFLFIIGSGMWMLDGDPATPDKPAEPPTNRGRHVAGRAASRYARSWN